MPQLAKVGKSTENASRVARKPEPQAKRLNELCRELEAIQREARRLCDELARGVVDAHQDGQVDILLTRLHKRAATAKAKAAKLKR